VWGLVEDAFPFSGLGVGVLGVEHAEQGLEVHGAEGFVFASWVRVADEEVIVFEVDVGFDADAA
jgi:hypothetical protein